ncbi:MAG: tRNA (N6-threonylcarbamoyladenosine(37)-N6)-methyltransferase TrmO [Eubacteriales bacterium]|nr:tRNA (N6-threonylcarbamoyladenosine(37)-N6)-methyltransferase TrmO [Eubacteriales bacterium]
MEIRPVAHIYTDFPTKFGVPRQSGTATALKGTIVFENFYRDPEAVKGLDGFDYIWVLWDFSKAHRKDGEWAATACPPRLGGKTHMGIWATRSPFRPNNIGLSSVRLDSIEFTEDRGPVLHVSGIDMMDGTPVYDIKPYIRYDCHPDARDGYVAETSRHSLKVEDPEGLIESAGMLNAEQKRALWEVLSEDPRPQFDADDSGQRRYGFYYGTGENGKALCDVRFTVCGNVLTVVEIVIQ